MSGGYIENSTQFGSVLGFSNDQRQLREISHFSIPSWPTSWSRPRKRPSRQSVTLAAAAAPPPPPIAVTLSAAVTLAAYRRAACVPPPVHPSINCTKLQLSSFIPRFQLFLSVAFLCNYLAGYVKGQIQICKGSDVCNLGRKTRDYAIKFWAPSGRNSGLG